MSKLILSILLTTVIMFSVSGYNIRRRNPTQYETTFRTTPRTTTKPQCRLTCYENSYINFQTCRCDCIPGYYYDSTVFKCVKPITTIPPTTIISTTTKPQCLLTCYENSFENYDTCSCICLPGYYFDSSVFKCVKPVTTLPPTSTYTTSHTLSTTSRNCNLDCRLGFSTIENGVCKCICIEFYRFNGTTCVLSNMYPIVPNCNDCLSIISPFNRPMRCVETIYDRFCVP